MTIETIAIQCRICSVYGGPTHVCQPRTLPDRPRGETFEPLPIVGRRREARSLSNAEANLEMLARHLPTLMGSALNPEPTVPSGRAGTGRADHVDEVHAEIDDACRVLRKLALVPRKHLRVLLFAFLVNGKESRDRWPSFVSRLGLVFASSGQRKAWTICEELRGAESGFGLDMYSSALAAYALTPAEAPITDGQWLPAVLDTISRMVTLADKELLELKRIKVKRGQNGHRGH